VDQVIWDESSAFQRATSLPVAHFFEIESFIIQLGNPQKNAYIKRYNSSVLYDWLSPHQFDGIEEVQDYGTRWFWTYKNEQPNMALVAA